jgi:two-component system LytT family response regulator
VKTLLYNLSQNENIKIGLSNGDGVSFVCLTEIVRFKAEGNYTWVFFSCGGKQLLSKTLKEYEDLLEGQNFYRVHISDLINLFHLKQYDRRDGGYVVMTDGADVPISKRRKPEFLEKLGLK